ncbi:MAG: ParA family protein [Deltaproteobacteria bacterium]|nr:ParA family protein [Deltaproteobacteria bacterium]
MAKVLAVANQKGGVGKTTTSVNFAAGLALSRRRVLLVDMDPQGNSTSGVGLGPDERTPGLYEALIAHVPMAEVIRETSTGKLYVAPSGPGLIGAEVELVDLPDRNDLLHRALESVKDRFDYIVIDCPPSLGLLTINAMCAADELVVTLQAEYYALEGLSALTRTIDAIREAYNPRLVIGGILLTMMDRRTNLANQVEAEVRTHFGDRVFSTVIPRNVRLSEAPSFGQTIFRYDIKSSGAEAYLALAREFLKREKATDTP